MSELDSKLIKLPNNGYERKTWLKGAHEDLGEVVQGWSGVETVITRRVIKPIVIFEVR